MEDTNTIVLGIVIALFFIWRFARARQLYLTSLQGQTTRRSESSLFNTPDLRSVVQKTLLGRRSIKPISFFIRAFVFMVVTVCLLPVKGYGPCLYWLIVALVALYVPWCVVLGVMLKKRNLDGGTS